MGCTWYKIVSRLRGAVTVLATDPAIPPQKSCFNASTARESGGLTVGCDVVDVPARSAAVLVGVGGVGSPLVWLL